MPRQHTVQALHLSAGDARADDEWVDYDTDYRALDLEPGAPPREIADRARLLLAAFDADQVPPGLRARALARAQIVERAAASLSQYWREHGAPPPRTPGGAPLALSERFLAALAEVLGTGEVEARGAPATAHPPLQASALPAIRPADRVAVFYRRHTDAAIEPVLAWAAVSPSGRAAPIAGPQGDALAMLRQPLSPAGRLPAITVTASKAAMPIVVAPHHLVVDQTRAAPGRRPGSAARSVLVRLVLVGLVATAVIRVLQYRAEHADGVVAGEPYPAISTALPSEPPVRWSGLAPPQQPTGAAAQAAAARLR